MRATGGQSAQHQKMDRSHRDSHRFVFNKNQVLPERLCHFPSLRISLLILPFCFLQSRCLLVDFDRPTGPDGSHPQLFNWVLDYFRKYEDFKPPLYLQHHGHSRTIVGIEEFKDGHLTLLVFDPSHSPEQMYQFKNTATGYSGMKLIRKTMSTMKARQYQLVAVIGIMESESEYQVGCSGGNPHVKKRQEPLVLLRLLTCLPFLF